MLLCLILVRDLKFYIKKGIIIRYLTFASQLKQEATLLLLVGKDILKCGMQLLTKLELESLELQLVHLLIQHWLMMKMELYMLELQILRYMFKWEIKQGIQLLHIKVDGYLH